MLTNMLSDRRLSMKHNRIESVLLIAGNDKNWSAREREEIIERAVGIYLMKRRKTKTCEPPQKMRIVMCESEDYICYDAEDNEDSDISLSSLDEEL